MAYPEEIEPEILAVRTHSRTMIGGEIDRQGNQISVANGLPMPSKRFTIGHEFGHLVLHLELIHHRDVPLIGSERTEERGRSPQEQEADFFAAELLMPAKVIEKLFNERYGAPISAAQIDESFAFQLSRGIGRELSASNLVKGGRRKLARLMSRNTYFAYGFDSSLITRFGVSEAALAIQLEELGLVLA
jgi:hypothetical protein